MPRFLRVPTADEISKLVEDVKPTNIVGQLEFVTQIAESKVETAAFIADPENFMLKHKVVLDPDVAKLIVDVILFQPIVPLMPDPLGPPPPPKPKPPPGPAPPGPDPIPPESLLGRLTDRYHTDAMSIFKGRLNILADRANPHAFPAAVVAIAAVVAALAAVASAVCGCSKDRSIVDAMKGFDPKTFSGIGIHGR